MQLSVMMVIQSYVKILNFYAFNFDRFRVRYDSNLAASLFHCSFKIFDVPLKDSLMRLKSLEQIEWRFLIAAKDAFDASVVLESIDT